MSLSPRTGPAPPRCDVTSLHVRSGAPSHRGSRAAYGRVSLAERRRSTTTDTLRSPSTWSASRVPHIWMPAREVLRRVDRIARSSAAVEVGAALLLAEHGVVGEAARCARTIASIARSASVTGDVSAFVSSRSASRKDPIPMTAASSAVVVGECELPFEHRGHPTRPQRRRSAGSLDRSRLPLRHPCRRPSNVTDTHTVKLTVEVPPESSPRISTGVPVDREPGEDPGVPQGEGAEADHRRPDRS